MASNASPRPVAILGSTGSIGCNSLDVIAGMPERFRVVALAAGANVNVLAHQIATFRPRLVSVRTPEVLAELRGRLRELGIPAPAELLAGPEGLRAAAAECDAKVVVAATVGVPALGAIHAALERGVTLALANKEALVVAGPILLDAARQGGATILPVDSEHSAVHQCLRAGGREEVESVILTASGGPFLRHGVAELAKVTAESARQHPTWKMGTRISLDSATLMNKGFEVIEACHLFQVPESRVQVLVHPQSILHSMVEFRDGSVIAQMGTTDMRTPIQYALTWPERVASPRTRLRLEMVQRLEFETPDEARFQCLRLARAALRAGSGAGAVLNAADEVALEAFQTGRVPFAGIAGVIEACLTEHGLESVHNLDEVLDLDRRTRATAELVVAAGV